MKLIELNTKVVGINTRGSLSFNPMEQGTKAIIVGVYYHSNNPTNKIIYSLRTPLGHIYTLEECQFKVIETKKLFAYQDSSKEVHWNTLELSPAQRKAMGLERVSEFDKEFDV